MMRRWVLHPFLLATYPILALLATTWLFVSM